MLLFLLGAMTVILLIIALSFLIFLLIVRRELDAIQQTLVRLNNNICKAFDAYMNKLK